MTTAEYDTDPVDPRQRRQARVLGFVVTSAFLALVAGCFIMFSINGLPKDAKEWKRLQERRSAAEAEKAEQGSASGSTIVPTLEKDATR